MKFLVNADRKRSRLNSNQLISFITSLVSSRTEMPQLDQHSRPLVQSTLIRFDGLNTAIIWAPRCISTLHTAQIQHAWHLVDAWLVASVCAIAAWLAPAPARVNSSASGWKFIKSSTTRAEFRTDGQPADTFKGTKVVFFSFLSIHSQKFPCVHLPRLLGCFVCVVFNLHHLDPFICSCEHCGVVYFSPRISAQEFIRTEKWDH